jgi:glycosyltransferase involved in cell wall biosynthesis
VGEGVERARLEQLAKSLEVENSVIMPGFQANVPAILPLVDVCIHPSVDEAFGIVLLEAMAARKPVVATQVGGIPEIVGDGITGLLVPPRDPSAIADAVCALLRDEPLRKRMGAAGRVRVEREFTIQKTVRSYEALYDEIARRDG